MRIHSCIRSIRLSLVILCIAAVSGIGNVTAHQRGDASLPEANDAWAEVGVYFISPDQPSGSTISGDTYVLPTSGTEVIVADGVSATDPAETTFEDQLLLTIPGGIGAVAVLQGLGFPHGVMEAYVEGFAESLDNVEEVDVQSDRGHASGLYIVDMDGVPTTLYINVDAVTSPGNFIIQVAVAITGDVAAAVALLRDNVLVDGIPMFDGVDEQALQSLLNEHLGN